jgi:hypothetical protein
MIVRDCPVHQFKDKAWVSLPAKPMLDKEHNLVRDQGGRIRYIPTLEFTRDAAAPPPGTNGAAAASRL